MAHRLIQLVAAIVLLAAAHPLCAAAQSDRLNVLFIAVDDLRPELGCYGVKEVISPNIDRLASRGLVFNRAYCQQAVCGASRTSLLTGLRPDTTKVWGNNVHFRKAVPDVVTLPQQFKNHGYHTQALGKIYHGAFASAYVGTKMHDPPSWSVQPFLASPRYYFTERGVEVARRVYARTTKKSGDKLDGWVDDFVRGLATEAPDVADNVPYDGVITDRAIEAMRQIRDRPFFLAVGFLKPHLPFIAPKRYWDMYDPQAIQLSPNPHAPEGVPAIALHNSSELRYYDDIPSRGPINDEMARRLIHGYRACVTYVDALVGRLLEELDRLNLADRTIVILWGDHGWQLGDLGMWGKATNFELSTRVPMIVAAPGMKAVGQSTNALVEFVDIYPGLCELAGLPRPDHLEGTSFAPLLNDPTRAWKSAAFSQYPRGGDAMGYSMRTDRYRFTRWQKRQDASQVVAMELYDHATDPHETRNLAGLPKFASLIDELSRQLDGGWRAARPKP